MGMAAILVMCFKFSIPLNLRSLHLKFQSIVFCCCFLEKDVIVYVVV